MSKKRRVIKMFLDNLFTTIIGKPKWRVEFEEKMLEIERKTGLSREELIRVVNVIEEMRIIRPETANSPKY
jgi:hypothetical protein